MPLRDLLDLCQDKHSDDWVLVPGNRPATTMLAGVFDPGMKDEVRTRPLAGHSIAIYEPDPQLSMVWPIPEEPEAEQIDWYLDWGSGIGGYVPYIEAVFGDDYVDGERPVVGWDVSQWAVGLARLINAFGAPREWYTHDPTSRLVPKPEQLHPIDAHRAGF